MGTYDASKYRTARKAKQCRRCDAPIYVGALYLAYKPGLRSNCPICFSCSRIVVDNHPVYWCHDVVEAIRQVTASRESASD